MPKLQLENELPLRKPAWVSSGSGALLVILNVGLSGIALVPLLLQWLGWLSALGIKYVGGAAIMAMMAALIAEAAIGKAGYVVWSAVPVAAFILIPLLLFNPGIRWPLKLAVVAGDLGAIGMLIRTVGRLMLQYQQGHFKGF